MRNWTREELEQMGRLWTVDKLSASQIAAMFGVTRNSVIGLSHRNRELFGKKPGPVRKYTPEERKERLRIRDQKRTEQRRREREENAVIVKPDLPKPLTGYKIHTLPYDLARMPHAKTLADLAHYECKWPLNSEGPQLFCAEATGERKSYCDHHHQRSRGEGTISERRAVRDARHAA